MSAEGFGVVDPKKCFVPDESLRDFMESKML